MHDIFRHSQNFIYVQAISNLKPLQHSVREHLLTFSLLLLNLSLYTPFGGSGVRNLQTTFNQLPYQLSSSLLVLATAGS